MGKICLQKIMYIAWISSLVFYYKYTYDLGRACVLFFCCIFWSKICVFLIKIQTSNLNDIHYFCVGIFYPYQQFKSDCKLFGKSGVKDGVENAHFKKENADFLHHSLTQLVKIGVTK